MTNYNPFSLENKTILVTGASSGIGRGVALACSKMGAEVRGVGRNMERLDSLLQEMSQNHISCGILKADLTNPADVEIVADNMPELDGVVHCAGIGDRTLLKMVRQKDLDRVMKTNFEAPVLLQRALLKKKKINPNASIVFMASRAPFAPTVGNGLYSASKGALIAYAKVLGLELADKLIRVNCVCPAMVWTELIERDAKITGADYHQEELKYPLRRYGTPEDIANLCIYLLSDASSWVTGSCIDVTGGGEFTLKA